MADIKSIDTSKYIKEGKVKVDGNVWEVKLPGAGVELKMSKIQRRYTFLGKRVEDGTITEEQLDYMDTADDFFYNFFSSIFKDGTKDNKAVKDWIANTPLAVIQKAFEDIKRQADSKE